MNHVKYFCEIFFAAPLFSCLDISVRMDYNHHMRKATALSILGLCYVFLASQAFAESSNIPTKKARDRASKVMTSLLPGPPEMSCAMASSGAKNAAISNCSCKAGSRLEKGITSVVGGVWQLATFWCPETDCDKN